MAISRLVLELALIDGASSAVRRAAQEVKGFGEAGRSAAKDFEDAGRHFGNALKGMAVAQQLKTELVDPGVEAAKTLQAALADLEVNLDASSVEEVKRQLADARSEAGRISAPTKFSAEEVLGITTGLKKAGLDVNDILGQGGAAEASAQLATAEKLSADQALNAMVTAGNMFELQGAEFTRAADSLARAGGASSTDAGALAEALGQAPNVGALGLGMDESFAAIGLLGGRGKHGGAAGTALNAFLRQASKEDAFFDAEGKFVGMQGAAQVLREGTAGMSDQRRQQALQETFGDEGVHMALALLAEGDKSYESVLSGMERSKGLQEKVGVIGGTQLAQEQALQGSTRTLLATLFDPVLDPLGQATGKANELVGQANAKAAEDERIAKAASFGAVGAVGAAGAFSVASLGLGLFKGGRGLGGLLRGGFGTAAGVAQGKALEQAAGVQPVFVTNWPGAISGPAGPLGAAGGVGMAGKAGLAGLAGAAGFAGGSLIQDELIAGSGAQPYLQAAMGVMSLANPLLDLFQRLAALQEGGLKEALTLNTVDVANRSVLDAGRQAFDVVVNIDRQGGAAVEVREKDSAVSRALARVGAG